MSARILVIEDNANNLDLITYLLVAFGHTVLTATSGPDGIAIAERERLSLIVCDIQMPGMDGFAVSRRLRSRPGLNRVPLIAVTALAMVGDRERILTEGFDGYIAKPLNPETFVSQVEAFLRPEECGRDPRIGRDPGAAMPRPVTRQSGFSVLTVDNSTMNLDVVRATLEPSGYRVVAVGGMKDAINHLARERFDIIISDIHLSGESGYDLLAAVKSAPALESIPFLFLSSSSAREHELARALEMGAAGFISRPIEPADLLVQIEYYLRCGDRNALSPGREHGDNPGS